MNKMMEKNQASFALRMLVGLAAAGLVLYFMHLMSGLINNLFLAFMIAVIASPLLLWLRKKGAPNWLAFLLTLVVVALGVVILIGFVANAAAELATAVPKYIDEAQDLQLALAAVVANIDLGNLNIGAVLNLFEFQQVFQAISAFAGSVLDALSNAFIIILFVVFMLVQVFTTPQLLRSEIVSGNTYLLRVVAYIKNLRQYLLITAAIAVVTGVSDTIWFVILGIPNPLIWGGVAAILSFVPTIGFWLAAIPPTLLALFEYGPLTAAITLAGILLINGFADNYIKPRYIGTGLDLAPFIVVFSVIFWALILGPIGAIIGVPMTMLFKSLLLEPDDQFSWVARVMGSGQLAEETAEAALETADGQDTSDLSGEV
jgi:predicted PurR-regulated permease PerM